MPCTLDLGRFVGVVMKSGRGLKIFANGCRLEVARSLSSTRSQSLHGFVVAWASVAYTPSGGAVALVVL